MTRIFENYLIKAIEHFLRIYMASSKQSGGGGLGEFSHPSSCLDEAMLTRERCSIASIQLITRFSLRFQLGVRQVCLAGGCKVKCFWIFYTVIHSLSRSVDHGKCGRFLFFFSP